jgi:putative acetyltransferase
MEILRVTPADPRVQQLVVELDAELTARFPGERIHGFHAGEADAFRGAFLLVLQDGAPVACGGVRVLGPELGELKRMVVRPHARRQGLGRRLVAALEDEARALGLDALQLETGRNMQDAIALYERAGFARIPRYGEYVDNPDSVCMRKVIGRPAAE